jgi:hypothetical protein
MCGLYGNRLLGSTKNFLKQCNALYMYLLCQPNKFINKRCYIPARCSLSNGFADTSTNAVTGVACCGSFIGDGFDSLVASYG